MINSSSSIGAGTGVTAPALADSGTGSFVVGGGVEEIGREVSRRSCARANFDEAGLAILIAGRRLR